MIRTFQEFLNRATKEEYQRICNQKVEESGKNRLSKDGWALSQTDVDSMTVFDVEALMNDLLNLSPDKEAIEQEMSITFPCIRFDVSLDHYHYKLYHFENYIFVFESVRSRQPRWWEEFNRHIKSIFCQRVVKVQSLEDLIETVEEPGYSSETVDMMTFEDRMMLLKDLDEKCCESKFCTRARLNVEKWYKIGANVVKITSYATTESNEEVARHMDSFYYIKDTTFDDL